jgi:two-component system sensor histidine kinase KdpD
VDHLLDATRLETGALQLSFEWCEPDEIAREAVGSAGVDPSTVRLEVPPNLPAIKVDAALLAQALGILLHNAVTHGSGRESPTLRARSEPGTFRFEITDRGAGLPAGKEKDVFAAFQRGPSVPAGGLGLGLSIARRIAELHGGTLDGENRPDGGARFTLSLPLAGEMKLPAA